MKRSSPVIADINGNPGDGNETAVGDSAGYLSVYRSNGQPLWSKQIVACQDSLHAAPAVGAIFGNGVPYVVMTYGLTGPGACDGGIVAYRGSDGAEAWRFSLRAWASQQGYQEGIYGVISSPALADTDNDGRMEIGFGGLDRNVYLLNADGSVRWYYHAADTSWSSPAFADINGDGRREMIIGTDIGGNPALNLQDGGFVYAFDTRPRSPVRVEFQQAGGFLWRSTFDQVIFSSPVVADVLPSNPGAEIIIGNGCYFPTNSSDKRGRWIKILRLSDGAVLQTLNASACVQSSVAVGDLDDDGLNEIVATVNGATQIGGDGKSRITAWKATNPNPLWSTTPSDPSSGNNDPFGGDLQSPVIADLDGNGSLEVIAANDWTVHVLNGRNGVPLTCQNPQCGAQLSLFAWKTLKSTPAVGAISGNTLSVVIGGGHINANNRGMLYGWTGFAGLLNSPQGGQAPYSAPWPMFRGNAQHTGVLTERRVFAAPAGLSALVGPNRERSNPIVFTGPDNTPINWSASIEDPTGLVGLNRTSGSSADPLVVAVRATGGARVGPGSYTATLTVRADGLAPTSVPITVIVVNQVFDRLLPLVQR